MKNKKIGKSKNIIIWNTHTNVDAAVAAQIHIIRNTLLQMRETDTQIKSNNCAIFITVCVRAVFYLERNEKDVNKIDK